MQRKTLVHICGLNIHIPDWSSITVGDPENGTYGTLPTGLIVAFTHNADLSFGTGATSTSDGKSEAAYSRDILYEILPTLTPISADTTYAHSLLETARVDEHTANTRQELSSAIDHCLTHGYTRLTIVTNRTHAPRVMMTLNILLNEQHITLDTLSPAVFPSDTSLSDGPEKIVLFEPPHIPEDPRMNLPDELEFHTILSPLFELFASPEKLRAVLQELREVITRHTK